MRSQAVADEQEADAGHADNVNGVLKVQVVGGI